MGLNDIRQTGVPPVLLSWYLETADGVGGAIAKLQMYSSLGWNSTVVVCYVGITVDLSVNESFNSQCIDQVSLGISYCCRWVCRGQFRQMPLAVLQHVTLFLSRCHLTSAVMTEPLESSLWFKSAVRCWLKGKGPPFFLPGERARVSSHHILPLLLSRLPAFNSSSCFRANLLSCDTRYTELCPGDVIFHQAHLLLTRVVLLHCSPESGLRSLQTGPARDSWFPPARGNGVSAWGILWDVSASQADFTTVFLRGCTGSTSSLSPWRNGRGSVICPQRQHLFYSHPLEMSEKRPGENTLAQLTDR